MAEHDVVIVGGGHNGLVAAGYLAKAGARVLVLEQRPMVGGACISEETWPGYHISTYAYAAGLLRPKIVEELELRRFGYTPILCDPQAFAPFPDGRSITFWLDEERTQREVARFSKADARAYPKYLEYWDRVLALIEPALLQPPVALAEFLGTWKEGDPEALLRDLFLRSAAELLDDWFESAELKGAFATSAIIGMFAGPSTPGTAYILGHHNLGVLDGHQHVWGYARGGMGGITQAMARAAAHFGAEIRTDVRVRKILVQNGRAAGVEVANGKPIASRVVVSSLDLKQTFLHLLSEEAVEKSFRDRVGRIRTRGACLKFNAALRAPPDYRAAPSPRHLVGAVDIGPSIDYLDRAFDEAKYGRFSRQPFVDSYHQSLLDPTVAPPGRHTLTAFVQYAPTELRGTTWDEFRPQVAETVLGTVEEYAPNIRQAVEHWQVVTPADIERHLGMTGGNIDQGDITPDQIFSFRPLAGWAGYRTPIPGLYLCGSATHPGGGVLGAPGHNAARVILEDIRAANAASTRVELSQSLS